jgi:hypothetical protein
VTILLQAIDSAVNTLVKIIDNAVILTLGSKMTALSPHIGLCPRWHEGAGDQHVRNRQDHHQLGAHEAPHGEIGSLLRWRFGFPAVKRARSSPASHYIGQPCGSSPRLLHWRPHTSRVRTTDFRSLPLGHIARTRL